MRIALVTEGTYPVRAGGVSTWCDQLLNGLPDYVWTVVGLTATDADRAVLPVPPSVRSVVLHPLWGSQPPAPRWRGKGAELRTAVQEALFLLWDAALAPDGEEAVEQTRDALRTLFGLSATTRLASLLAAHGSTPALLAAWKDRCAHLPPMSVAEAVSAATIIDRTLAAVDAPVPRVDLVHAGGNGAAALVGLASRWRHGTPMVLSEHGVYLRERYLALDDGRRSWAERRAVTAVVRRTTEVAYREAECVLPVSDFNKRWAERLGGLGARVVTIRNGVETGLYDLVEEEPAVPTLSFVGRIDPLKDLHTLVRAFALVRRQLPPARLRIFGPVPEGNEAYRDSVAALAEQLGVHTAVTFEGPTQGSRPAIAAGTLVVLSSISEGLPFTVMEAMMCGRATVSTDVGGVAECLDPERQGGMIVPAGDPQAFATACLQLLTDDDRRHAMAAAARRHALSAATLDRALLAYRSAYESATDRTPVWPVRRLIMPRDVTRLLPQQRRSPAESLVGGIQ